VAALRVAEFERREGEAEGWEGRSEKARCLACSSAIVRSIAPFNRYTTTALARSYCVCGCSTELTWNMMLWSSAELYGLKSSMLLEGDGQGAASVVKGAFFNSLRRVGVCVQITAARQLSVPDPLS
jgi:hypothetical protein